MEYTLKINDTLRELTVDKTDTGFSLSTDGETVEVELVHKEGSRIDFTLNGKMISACVIDSDDGKAISIDGTTYHVDDADRVQRSGTKSKKKEATEVTPPMPAVVIRILVNEGDVVEKGSGVAVVSAMKMETTLNAPYTGVVTSVNYKEGDKVMPGDILVDIEKIEEEKETIDD